MLRLGGIVSAKPFFVPRYLLAGSGGSAEPLPVEAQYLRRKSFPFLTGGYVPPTPVSPTVAAAQPQGYQGVRLTGALPRNLQDAVSVQQGRDLATAINNILKGKINAVLSVALAAGGATATVLTDQRLSAFSGLAFTPLTPHAAAIASSIYVTAQGTGTATLAHTANSNTDCLFNITIIG